MIQINLTDTGVHAELARLVNAFDNPQPALKSIGELVVEFTKTRFEVSQDPYGKPWAPNTDTTLRRCCTVTRRTSRKSKAVCRRAASWRCLARSR
jgi:hypothetical protein